MKKLLFILVLLSLIIKISAQEPDDETPAVNRNSPPQKKDTTKLRISIRQLRSDMLTFDSIPFDTILANIHVQNPISKKYLSSSFLGNYGLAAKSNNYFEQNNSEDFFFTNNIKYNFIHTEDILYYRTNRPFSYITYNSTASKNVDLQSIKFLHTQNVNKNLNLGLFLKLHGSNGLYQKQKSTSNALSLFSGYSGDFYSMNTVISYNTLKNEENGGLSNDTLFEDATDKPEAFPVELQNANVNYRNMYIFINQRFNLAGLRSLWENKNDSLRKFSGIGLLHTLEFDRNKRKYEDISESSISTSIKKFYPEYNIDSITTSDSLYFFRFQNKLELLLGKQNPNEPPILIRAGIKNIYDIYNRAVNTDVQKDISNKDSTVLNSKKFSQNNLALTGGISLGIKSFFLLNATADLFLQGYKAGDFSISGVLSNKLSRKPGSPSFDITMNIANNKPGYFLSSFFSNHYKWENNFTSTKEVQPGFDFRWPAIKFEAAFHYSLISSPVYFDTLAYPRQFSGEVSVIQGFASKGFQAGIFHTSIKAMLQVTSNDKVIPLPLISAYNSSYIEVKLFKKVMTAQIGFDLRYNTSYYANGYMPALGVFYNQQNKKLGNYPFVDAFLNIKIKRMRFYLKFEHVNADLLSRTYYSVAHYPLNSRMLVYGLSWNFYD